MSLGRPFALRLKTPPLQSLERLLLRLLLQQDPFARDPEVVDLLPADLRAVLELVEPSAKQERLRNLLPTAAARARSRRRRLLTRAEVLVQRASRNVPSSTQRRVPLSGVVKCQNGSR
jgi:hypothetical protein